MSVQDQLLTLLLNSKKGGDLPVINNLENTDKIIVFDVDTGLVSTVLKSNLGLNGVAGTSSKIDVDIDFDGQDEYTLTSKPDNIDLVINRVPQHEGTDYTYNTATGLLTITNASVAASITTSSVLDVRGFQNFFSKKQPLTIPSAGHTTYTLSERPNNIDLRLNRTNLTENIDYTYDNSTGLITITNSSFISQITLNSILEARKIF